MMDVCYHTTDSFATPFLKFFERSFLLLDNIVKRCYKYRRTILGPGTLYTILGKLTDEQMIRETAVDGRRRTYETTEAGDKLYDNEVARLRRCLRDADAVRGEEEPPC